MIRTPKAQPHAGCLSTDVPNAIGCGKKQKWGIKQARSGETYDNWEKTRRRKAQESLQPTGDNNDNQNSHSAAGIVHSLHIVIYMPQSGSSTLHKNRPYAKKLFHQPLFPCLAFISSVFHQLLFTPKSFWIEKVLQSLRYTKHLCTRRLFIHSFFRANRQFLETTFVPASFCTFQLWHQLHPTATLHTNCSIIPHPPFATTCNLTFLSI